MSNSKLSELTRKALTNVSTATIFTALFKRGLRNQYIHDVRPVDYKNKNLVGQAYTL